MITRFTAHRPRTLRGLIVITAALLGAVLPVTAAPAASAGTAPGATPIVRAAGAFPHVTVTDGSCAQATVLALEKRRLLKNADHLAGAVDAVLRTPTHHRCAALVDYLRQTSA